jgi:hypothetical protein
MKGECIRSWNAAVVAYLMLLYQQNLSRVNENLR